MLTANSAFSLTAVETTRTAGPVTLHLDWQCFVTSYDDSSTSTTADTLIFEVFQAIGRTSFDFLRVGAYALVPHHNGDLLVSSSFTLDLRAEGGTWYAFKVRPQGGAFSPVYRVRTAGPDSAPVVLPRSEVAPVYTDPFPKWRLQTFDGSDFYLFETNPNQETSPVEERVLSYSWSPQLGPTATRAGRSPVQYSFSGTLRSRAQHEAFKRWAARTDKVYLITDLGEVHKIRLVKYAPVLEAQRQGRALRRQTYTMTCLLYDAIPGEITAVPMTPSVIPAVLHKG